MINGFCMCGRCMYLRAKAVAHGIGRVRAKGVACVLAGGYGAEANPGPRAEQCTKTKWLLQRLSTL